MLMEKFNSSKRKLKKEIAEAYGLDASDPNFKVIFDEIVGKMGSDRISKYNKRLFQKYSLVLAGKVFEWSKDHLSPAEYEESGFEEIMVRYFAEADDVSSKDIERIFDPKTGKLKPFVKDPYSDDLRWPDVAKAQEGKIEELPPEPKKNPQAPAMPSEGELKSMSADEIGKIIKQAQAAGVKE